MQFGASINSGFSVKGVSGRVMQSDSGNNEKPYRLPNAFYMEQNSEYNTIIKIVCENCSIKCLELAI
jgi:hypothetical protein